MTDHSHDAAPSDAAPAPPLTTEEADFLLGVYLSGWMSGAMTILANRPGPFGAPMPPGEAQVLAQFLSREINADPAVRHEILDSIRHLHEQRHKGPDAKCPGCAQGDEVRSIDLHIGERPS